MHLEKKILAFVAVGLLAVLVAVFAILPNSDILRNIVPQGPNVPTSLTAISTQIKPITVQYNGTSITSVTDRDATLKTNFYITNPNNTTIILEYIKYDVYANGVLIGYGQLGERMEQSWQSSYYFPLIEGTSNNIGSTTDIKNTGNTPDVWSALQQGTAKLTVTGTVYYAVKTAFSGQDFSTDFNFTKS
jgi:LEA14-like dessication related protein